MAIKRNFTIYHSFSTGSQLWQKEIKTITHKVHEKNILIFTRKYLHCTVSTNHSTIRQFIGKNTSVTGAKNKGYMTHITLCCQNKHVICWKWENERKQIEILCVFTPSHHIKFNNMMQHFVLSISTYLDLLVVFLESSTLDKMWNKYRECHPINPADGLLPVAGCQETDQSNPWLETRMIGHVHKRANDVNFLCWQIKSTCFAHMALCFVNEHQSCVYQLMPLVWPVLDLHGLIENCTLQRHEQLCVHQWWFLFSANNTTMWQWITLVKPQVDNPLFAAIYCCCSIAQGENTGL